MIKSLNLELIIAKTPEYLQDQSCLGCTYFRQVKGHFGECVAALDKKNNPINKYYDGTKKGSACSLYRTSITLPESLIVKKQEDMKDSRLEYNQVRRKRYVALKRKGNPHYAKHGLNENIVNKHNVKVKQFSNFYSGLPYQLTSDTINRKKSGYFMHKHNHHVINFALKMIKDNMTSRQIIEKIKQFYGVELSKSVIYQWKMKFLKIKPKKYKQNVREQIFGAFWNVVEYGINEVNTSCILPNPICPICKSNDNVMKHGQRYNLSGQVQRYECKICNKGFSNRGKYAKCRLNERIIERFTPLFKIGLTTREISQVILKENGVKVAHNTIAYWLRKENPDIKFKQCGSHRPEVRLKISQTLKRKSEINKIYTSEVLVCP